MFEELLVFLSIFLSLSEETVVGLSEDLGLHQKLFLEFLASALVLFFANHAFLHV